jgi:hypothetical protein
MMMMNMNYLQLQLEAGKAAVLELGGCGHVMLARTVHVFVVEGDSGLDKTRWPGGAMPSRHAT